MIQCTALTWTNACAKTSPGRLDIDLTTASNQTIATDKAFDVLIGLHESAFVSYTYNPPRVQPMLLALFQGTQPAIVVCQTPRERRSSGMHPYGPISDEEVYLPYAPELWAVSWVETLAMSRSNFYSLQGQ